MWIQILFVWNDSNPSWFHFHRQVWTQDNSITGQTARPPRSLAREIFLLCPSFIFSKQSFVFISAHLEHEPELFIVTDTDGSSIEKKVIKYLGIMFFFGCREWMRRAQMDWGVTWSKCHRSLSYEYAPRDVWPKMTIYLMGQKAHLISWKGPKIWTESFSLFPFGFYWKESFYKKLYQINQQLLVAW